MTDIESELHDLRQRSGQLSDGRVLGAEIVDDRIEVEVKLCPSGLEVWARLTIAAGGYQAGVFRVPAEGDTVEVLMIDGDPTQCRVVGWTPTGAMPLPEGVQDGVTYVVASPGEDVRVVAHEGAKVVVDSDDIRLGGDDGPLEPVALAEQVRSELDAIWSAVNGHTHSGVSSGFSSTLPAVSGSAGDVGADKVQGE